MKRASNDLPRGIARPVPPPGPPQIGGERNKTMGQIEAARKALTDAARLLRECAAEIFDIHAVNGVLDPDVEGDVHAEERILKLQDAARACSDAAEGMQNV